MGCYCTSRQCCSTHVADVRGLNRCNSVSPVCSWIRNLDELSWTYSRTGRHYGTLRRCLRSLTTSTRSISSWVARTAGTLFSSLRISSSMLPKESEEDKFCFMTILCRAGLGQNRPELCTDTRSQSVAYKYAIASSASPTHDVLWVRTPQAEADIRFSRQMTHPALPCSSIGISSSLLSQAVRSARAGVGGSRKRM